MTALAKCLSTRLSENLPQMKLWEFVYGEWRELNFDHLANLFTPTTIDACYAHDGTGTVGGHKTDDGKWNIAGHRDRIVHVTDTSLAVFAQLYDEQGTPPNRARLPALHAGVLQSVLHKLAAYPRRLADLGGTISPQ